VIGDPYRVAVLPKLPTPADPRTFFLFSLAARSQWLNDHSNMSRASARAGNHHFSPTSPLRTLTKAPYKTSIYYGER
jgi:hypothetical protein